MSLDTVRPEPKPLKRNEKIMIIVILINIAIVWTLYGNIAAFYPPYCANNHDSINDTMVGVVLA